MHQAKFCRLSAAFLVLMAAALGAAANPTRITTVSSATTPRSSAPHSLVALDANVVVFAATSVLGVELWKSDGTAAGTVLVKDINPGTDGSSVKGLTRVNTVVYFTAGDAPPLSPSVPGNRELWKTDGTAAGTMRVKDILAGPGGSDPDKLVGVNATLFFVANDGVNGRELWKSDGTAAGTVMVKDITGGSGGSDLSDLTDINGVLYFLRRHGTNGMELWKSDGTEAGTQPVKDYPPSIGYFPACLTNLNGTLLFAANDGVVGPALWKSDGTLAGTVLVKDIHPGVDAPALVSCPVALGSVAYFGADDGVNGVELWKTDGTNAGTVMVKDIHPGTNSSGPARLVSFGGLVFFAANDGTHGSELWRSDGTAAGTVLVKDIAVPPGTGNSSPGSFVVFNGNLFFTAYGADELWKSDGTAAGTILVKDIFVGSSDGSPVEFTAAGNGLFFTASTETGTELWITDGSEAGTRLVADIFPGVSAPPGREQLPAWMNGLLFFAAERPSTGIELWRTDGSTPGTSLVRDIRPATQNSYPERLRAAGSTLYFTAIGTYGPSAPALWKSDGTEAGTVPVPLPVSAGGFIVVGNTVYSVSFTSPFTLWKSDGTAAGSVVVHQFPGYLENLTNVGGTLFVTSTTSGGAASLWKSDGTSGGTVMLKALAPGSVRRFTASGGLLFFVDADASANYELWKSDGTAAGTQMVKDINPGALGSNPGALVDVGGVLNFFAKTSGPSLELWRSDGTASGTVMVHGGPFNTVCCSTDVNGTLYFVADDGVHGTELWKSDGTAAGTVMVRDIASGALHSGAHRLTNVNGTLYFVADDHVTGHELWKSDGTAAGTVLVADLLPGPLGSDPSGLTPAGGGLYFMADDGITPLSLYHYTPNPGRMANISTRMQVLTGDDVMIGGFVIGGSASKTVAIVATGPSLTSFGITNPLANPRITLVRSSDQAIIATNDDWQADAQSAQLQAAGFAPPNALESALYRTLAPGAYTVVVQGAGGGTGVSVIGVYEADSSGIPLVNISTRGRVLTGNDVMIGGFVIQGGGPQAVSIVATGPSLAGFGIGSPLANPTITLVRSSDQAVIAANDDWQTDANASELQAAGFAPAHPLEAGLHRVLLPGAYTVVVQGAGGATGVAVVGVYKTQ